MKRVKIVLFSVAGTILVIVFVLGLLYELALRNVSRNGANQFATIMQNSLTRALVISQANATTSEMNQDMLSTYINALRTGSAAARLPAKNFPKTSEQIVSLSQNSKLDAWNHPFCLAAYESFIEVISAGPNARRPLECSEVLTRSVKQEISELKPLTMHQLRSGLLVLTLRSKRDSSS